MVKNITTIESTNRRKVNRVQKQKSLKIFKESEKLLNITNPCEIVHYPITIISRGSEITVWVSCKDKDLY